MRVALSVLAMGAWHMSAQAAIQASTAPSTIASPIPSAQAATPAVYAVVHVDVEPKDMLAAVPLLESYATQASEDPSVAHIDVLQQNGGTNHFTLVEDFRSEAAYKKFVAQGYVKHMRDSIQPMLGSPFDERLHSALMVR